LTILEQARKPFNKSSRLVGFTLGTLESEPLFVENLHIFQIEPDLHSVLITAGYTILTITGQKSTQ